MRNACKILIGKPSGKDVWNDLGILCTMILKLMLFMSMFWVCVSELRPLKGLFIRHMIHESGERRWNDADRGKLKKSETNLSQYHFANQKSYMDWPVREPGLHCKKPATSPELWHDRNWFCWNSFVGCGLGSSGPGRGPVVGCCEHGTEHSGST
jgi:hypothetical protein